MNTRHCPSCDKRLPISEFYKAHGRPISPCKACKRATAKIKQAEWRARVNQLHERKCGMCKKTLPTEDFYPGCARCKACQKAETKRHRERRKAEASRA